VSPKATNDDTSLRRLAGIGWQTRDGRFTIETASGTWSLLDAEQTDDLGLPLVRGPFRSLTEAKDAIGQARSSGPATSSLGARKPAVAKAPPAKPPAKGSADAPKKAARTKAPAEPEEPRWLSELDAPDRRRARRLLDRLAEMGVRDPEGVVRRDLAGDVPAVARVAVADKLAGILGDAEPATGRAVGRVLDALADGRDEALDVRWRLVDDAGRPIGLTGDDVGTARKRRSARH
jgi:hypothetical protein